MNVSDPLEMSQTHFNINFYTDEQLYGPKRDNLYIVIPMTIIYIIIFLTGLIGNVSTCVVIARNKSMHTATNYYLFSLAISDLLLLVSGLPPEIYSIWSRYPYVFGYTFCVLRGLFAETSANATVITITAFTIERYVAICHPFISHTMSKLSRVIKMILIIWSVAICFAIPQALQFGITPMIEDAPETIMCHIVNPIIKYSFEVSTIFFFVLPMTVITVLYAMIGLRLRSSTMMKREKIGGSNRNSLFNKKNGCRHQQSQSTQRVLKMLVAVVVAFFICWAPFHAQRLVATYVSFSNDEADNYKYLKIYEVVTYISGILYFLSTTINPLLYNIMSNKFREAFKETFARCCRLAGIKSGRPQRHYSVLSRSAQRGTISSDSCRDFTCSVHTNSTLIHKTSIDSMQNYQDMKEKRYANPSGKEKSWPNRAAVCVMMVSKTDLEKIAPHTHLVAIRIPSPPPTRMKRLLHILDCISNQNNADPISTCNENSKSSIKSYDISNSSLKEVEMDVLKLELSTYLNEKKFKEATTP